MERRKSRSIKSFNDFTMRIISGSLRGKKLHTFKGTDIRPTSDRTREAVFNILSQRVPGAHVLDLFAGSGAMGIEALSRHAATATFVDKAPAAIALIKKNIDACGLEKKARVIQWDIARSLDCLGSVQMPFDLIFLDPPYGRHLAGSALTHLADSRAVAPETCLVLEHGHAEILHLPSDKFQLKDQRRYGKTLVSFLNYMV